MVNCLPCCSSQPKVSSPRHEESLFIESMKVIIQQLHQSDPSDQIDSLIEFIDYLLQKIKASPEEASSSSFSWDSVASSTQLGADIIDKISTEAQKFEDVFKEMGNVALSGLKVVGEAHWLLLGLSVAAHALERCEKVRCNVSGCMELLQEIASLAKYLKQFREVMPGERDRLRQAVQTIVEGAVMCCGYIGKGKIRRYWSIETASAQLEKTNQSIRDIRVSLNSAVGLQTLRQTTFRSEQSPFELLDFKPVGIESQVAKVREMLDMEGTQPALAVVLCGFGGVGKSTLATSAIQSLNWPKLQAFPDFRFCRIKINYETPDKESHIIDLQGYIITAFGGRKLKLQNPEEGRKELQKVLEKKFCFLYIDNVVDKEYIGQLLPTDLLWFNKSNTSLEKTKLRILVTSREKNLKPKFNINCKEYEVHAFSDDAAEELLREKILQSQGQHSLDFDERSLMSSVARACRGVPLILSVFGNHLRGEREERSYREALEALREGNLDNFTDEDISGKLFFVYRKMRDEEEKDAFLDICKYFCGREWNLVANIVDPSRLESLQRRMLINKSESGQVIVHDILRLMGVKEAKHTRISNHEEFSEVFEDGDANLKSVKGISLVSDKSLTKLESRHLDAVCQSLRVLIIGDWVKVDGPPCKKAFKSLRYLSLGDVIDFPFEDACKLPKLTVFNNRSKHGMNLHRLPPSLKVISQEVASPDCPSFEVLPLQSLSSLRCFIVKTRKSVELPNDFHLPESLVDLQLNCCSQLPREFSSPTALERLSLDKCDMESLLQGFGNLKKLKYLSLEQCARLTSLPEELGLLSSMTTLNLHGCTLLEKLPVNLGMLTALEELRMVECKSLRELPQGFGGLSSLQKLDLSGCISLQRLPESFGKLPLDSLTLQSLHNLDELPESTGNMPRLTHLKLISCNSLTILPNSFVQLSCLESLLIVDCNKLVALPRDFGQLSCLKDMTVRSCPKLQELPHGFEALPALKSFQLINCSSLLTLPAGFGELKCLEFLNLKSLLISSLPEGFGKLKTLENLAIQFCLNLETLPDDFETLASLTLLNLWSCRNLNGGAMERIVELKLCYLVEIVNSPKLIKRWEEMREQEEYPLIVSSILKVEGHPEYFMQARDGVTQVVIQVEEAELFRAATVGLLGARYVQLDSTTPQLMERSASNMFQVGTAVLLFALPLHVEDHHHWMIKEVISEVAKETAVPVQIVYVKRVEQKGETTEKEEEEERDCFRQILMSMQVEGSCAIPSTDMRCHRLITSALFTPFKEHPLSEPLIRYTPENILGFCVLMVEEDDKGNKKLKVIRSGVEGGISRRGFHSSEGSTTHSEENNISNSNGNFIERICATAELSQCPPKESIFAQFLQILKDNDADHLIDSKLNKVELDHLKGKVVGIFICDQNTPEYIKLQQIYIELGDKSFKFEVLWIPLSEHEFYGLGTYTRALEKMVWTALPNPNVVEVKDREPRFIIFDEEGSIDNAHALSPMMSWGAVAYPFTKNMIKEIVSTIPADFSLNFLLHKINLVDKELIKNKLIFLYAEPPNQTLKMKSMIDQLVQLHGNFEILYVGYYFVEENDISTFKEIYENVTQKIDWPKLSFEDMVTFWYRCKYLYEEMKDQSNVTTQELNMLPKILYFEKRWLVVLDADGIVTRSGYEVVKTMCKQNDEKSDGVGAIVKNELLKNLKVGKCNEIVKTFFKDIINHPKHLHPLEIESRDRNICDVCGFNILLTWDQQRQYRCEECHWDLCMKCWELFVKSQVQNLSLTKDTNK